MRKILIMVAMVLVSTPAMAAWVKVTNLSGQPQRVTFSSAGSDVVRVIAPDATTVFIGADGMLALNEPATIAKAQAARPGPAGRLLGDVVASNRTARIPATAGDSFVIWPDGRLIIQSRRALRTMF